METPSSMRRATRSQTRSFSQKKTKQEETSSRSINNGNHERSVLQDISNDSPINGVATEKTPLSSVTKYESLPKKTPGSGEALLRGQVKILLEKVEEEAELVNKLSNRHCAPFLPFLGILPISPGLLAAPTPANTPQIFGNVRANEESLKDSDYGVVMENVAMVLPKVAESVKHEEPLEPQECVINRALLFDSPNKSEASDVFSTISSSVTYQGSIVCSSYDDNSSNWSIQANASAHENDEEDYFQEFYEEKEEDYCEENEEEEGYMDELCEELGKFTIEDKEMKKMPEFKGKHTRFLYNSEDEIEREEEIVRACSAGKALSPSVMRLKGLPLPEGKHLRFHDEDEE